MDFPERALLPKYQDIKRNHPTMLMPFKISFLEACAGAHVKKVLTISHRWMSREVADVDGAQFTAIRKHLKEKGDEIDFVWVDYSCMPQGEEKTAVQIADFKRMISQVNLLYLGTSVLILLDLSYAMRFWTHPSVALDAAGDDRQAVPRERLDAPRDDRDHLQWHADGCKVT